MMNCWLVQLRMAGAMAALSAIVSVAGCSGATSTGMAVPGSHSSALEQTARSIGSDSLHRLLYIAISNPSTQEVDVYPADIHIKNPQMIRKITTGLTLPRGLWVDKAGTLYVVNAAFNANGNVAVYPAGSSKPSMTIPNILNAHAVAVDDQGLVYVVGAGNFGNNGAAVEVFVFAPHSTKLVRTITMAPAAVYNLPGTIALDTHGNVFTTQFHRITKDFQICKAKHGATNGTLYIDHVSGTSIAIDGANNLYVGDPDDAPPSKIQVYAAGSKTPSRTIVGGASLSVAVDGTLYGGNGFTSKFDEYAPGASSPTNSFQYTTTYGLAASAVAR
jgi:hypothetical protein